MAASAAGYKPNLAGGDSYIRPEITAALILLKSLPLAGCIVTGDAIFAQKEICRVVKDGGGDYLFTVKDNRSALRADIALAFGGTSPLCRMVAAA